MATALVNAGQACIRDVIVIDPATSILDAARRMRERHVGCLVVTWDAVRGRMPVGMLTDRDIVTAIVAKDVSPASVHVQDAMTSPVVTAQESDGLVDVLRSMRRHGVRRVVVVGSQGQLVGLIALDDVMEIVAEQLHQLTGLLGHERRREEKSRP